jgi:hypothetical protein
MSRRSSTSSEGIRRGEIYFGEYGGPHYWRGLRALLHGEELVDGKCPDHQTVPEFRKEATTSSG